MATLIVLTFAVLGTVILVMPTVVRTYRKLRGPRVVMCPETAEHEIIEFAAVRAAATSAFSTPVLRVRTCSHWSGHDDCAQDCLADVDETAAEEHGLLTRRIRAE